MPVVIASINKYQGYKIASSLNTDTVIVSFGNESSDYMVEGYIDLRNMGALDSIWVCEEISVDGVVIQPFLCVNLLGTQSNPIYRFHTKTLMASMLYRVRYYHVTGYIFPVYFAFIQEVMYTV